MDGRLAEPARPPASPNKYECDHHYPMSTVASSRRDSAREGLISSNEARQVHANNAHHSGRPCASCLTEASRYVVVLILLLRMSTKAEAEACYSYGLSDDQTLCFCGRCCAGLLSELDFV